MNSFGHLVLVTLLVITIALSTSLAESQASSSAKQQATATRLETQQQQQNQQQRQPHKQRTHHHRNPHHPQERTRPEDVQQIRANNKYNADDAAQKAQQQQQQRQQLKQHHRQKQSRQLSIQQQQQQQQQKPQQQHHHHHQHEIHRRNATTAETTDTAPATAPRFRRISARDYYNQVTQGRSSPRNSVGNGNEWSYNNYNVHTNTFGGPSMTPSRAAGKGDDNTQDVEFIDSSSSHSHIDWSAPPLTTTTTTTTTTSPPPPAPARRSYSYDYVPPLVPGSPSLVPRRSVFGTAIATSAPPLPPPPPILPARRGYAAVTPATPSASADDPHTEDPFEGNTIGRSYPMDPQEMERRHICVQQRTIQMPVKTTEIYTRPIWKHINTPCQPQLHVNQMCTRVQLVHEPTYRDVIRHKSAQQVTYDCCAGWMREKPHMESCLMPICSTRCQNGGSCSGPDTCSCPSGFAGRYCEHDINECKEEKPCDQTCVNTLGSYYCKCRDGFILQDDQQSCKKIDLHDDDAFEARDLENEIESNDNVAARLQKIERSLANEGVQTHELKKSLQATYHAVDSLKSRLNTLEKQQQDINRLQSNLFATETRTNKLESMLSLLMKCRIGPNAHCP